MTATTIKVCGVTCVEDAEFAVAAGAHAVGVNLIPTSKRVVDVPTAARIAAALRGRACVVAVVADLPVDAARRLREAVGADLLQLHGSEPPAVLEALLPGAYKACRIGGPEDVLSAEAFGGERLLVDAFVPGELGGTGCCLDFGLVRDLAATRRLMLAGGLTPDNVSEAIRVVRPWGVDVASGVEREGDPRRKDVARLQRFVAAVRGT